MGILWVILKKNRLSICLHNRFLVGWVHYGFNKGINKKIKKEK